MLNAFFLGGVRESEVRSHTQLLFMICKRDNDIKNLRKEIY